jgi:uncharacterized membrane protein
MLWSAILVALVVAGFMVVSYVRRRLDRPEEAGSTDFTLADLRQLHRSGKISDQEFERAKAKILNRLTRSGNPPPPATH